MCVCECVCLAVCVCVCVCTRIRSLKIVQVLEYMCSSAYHKMTSCSKASNYDSKASQEVEVAVEDDTAHMQFTTLLLFRYTALIILPSGTAGGD